MCVVCVLCVVCVMGEEENTWQKKDEKRGSELRFSVERWSQHPRTKYKVYKVQSTKKKRNERRESDEEKEITHIEERNSPAWNELLCGSVRALCREGDSDCSTTNKAA